MAGFGRTDFCVDFVGIEAVVVLFVVVVVVVVVVDDGETTVNGIVVFKTKLKEARCCVCF